MRQAYFLTGAAFLMLGLAACAGAELEPTPQVVEGSEAVARPTPTTLVVPMETEEVVVETAVSLPTVEPAPLGEAGTTNFYDMIIGQTTIQYAVVLPQNFEPGNEYPVMLALPPGPQTRSMVQSGLDLYWGEAARLDDWIVVSPAAPGQLLYFEGAEQLLPGFLDRIVATYPPEGGKFHVTGISNGGLSAFRVAVEHPERVQSLTVLPGFTQSDTDFEKLANLVDIPVAMFVGEQDTAWLDAMTLVKEKLDELGGTVSLETVPGEGHVIQSLRGADLFAMLDSYRNK